MGFFKKTSDLLRLVDLFSYTQLVRYNGDDKYNSVSGGVISAMVLAIFAILFSSMGLKTISKEIISSTELAKN